ncbi:MAG: hypothetical protein N2036_05375 [Bryobacteraceae bacterium]|nr:hypothetical protein [Bryobacteraceae bacterium]
MRTGTLLLLWLAATPPETPEEDLGARLAQVKRLYVDRFGGGEGAAQIRDMVIASLQRTGLFVITENPDRADAVLRGSAEDLVYTDIFQSGEAVGARTNAAGGRGSTVRNRVYGALGAGVNESENVRIQERKHEASASVRIVARDGDVLWSTTQESQGGKFRSASADVAEKITRQLLADLERWKRPAARGAPAGGP